MNLKELAAKIHMNFIRVGFNPETERTSFIVLIGQERFDFFCGMFASLNQKQLDKTVSMWKSSPYYAHELELYTKIRQHRIRPSKNITHPVILRVCEAISLCVRPTAYDVLYCLRCDSEAIHMNFDDWCGTFGYDNDSIKALQTYNACIDNGKKLRKALGNELFQKILASQDE
jgi:hypothetical protein